MLRIWIWINLFRESNLTIAMAHPDQQHYHHEHPNAAARW
jgi:hypothetical protein